MHFLCVYYAFTGAVGFRGAAFGSGTGPILLDDASCTGTETELLACSVNAVGPHACFHSEDAGVRCQGRILHNQHYQLINCSFMYKYMFLD